jgi:hypothetical protein
MGTVTFTDAPFNAPTDGTSSASTAVDTWLTYAAANDGSTLIIPAYNGVGVASPYHLPGTNALTGPLKNATISAESGASVDALFIGPTNTQPENFTNSARIATIAIGATSATVITGPYPNDVLTDASFLSIGDTILIGGLSLQPDSFPANLQFFEYRKLTGKVSNTVSWTEPTRFSYDQTWPLRDVVSVSIAAGTPATCNWASHGFSANQVVSFTFDVGGSLPTGFASYQAYRVLASGLTANTFRFALTNGGTAINAVDTGSALLGHTTNADLGGPASISKMAAHHDGVHTYSGLRATQSGAVNMGGGRSVIIDNVRFDGIGPAPSLGESCIIRNCPFIGSQNEVDKLLSYLEYDNCAGSQIQVQSASVTDLVLKGGTVITTLNGTAINTSIEDTCSVSVLIGGATGFGRSNVLTVASGATIGAANPVTGTRVASHLILLSTVDLFSGGTFRFTNDLLYNAMTLFVPGYRYLVGYSAGDSQIHTIDNNGEAWPFRVLSMDRDATYLNVHTTLAAIPGTTFAGNAANAIFAYGVKTLYSGSSSSFLRAIEAFVEPSDTSPLRLRLHS